MVGVFDRMYPEDAMKWYGVISLINAAPYLLIYSIWQSKTDLIAAWKVGVLIKQFLWWPVGLCWLYTYINYDSKLNRTMLASLVPLSTLDPFAGSWIGMNMAQIHFHAVEDTSLLTLIV